MRGAVRPDCSSDLDDKILGVTGADGPSALAGAAVGSERGRRPALAAAGEVSAWPPASAAEASGAAAALRPRAAARGRAARVSALALALVARSQPRAWRLASAGT